MPGGELQDPEVVLRSYRDKGYNFLFLTDHNTVSLINNSIPNVEGILYFQNHMSLEDGMSYAHHIIALGIDRLLIQKFHQEKPERGMELDPDWNGQVNMHTRWCGNFYGRLEYYNYIGIAVIAHPHEPHGTEYLKSGWALLELLDRRNSYTGMEIFTGANAGEGDQPLCTDWWDRVLKTGRVVWGFGSDDSHNTHNNLKSFNRSWIMVNSDSGIGFGIDLEREIIKQIKEGNFFTVIRSPEVRGLTPSDGPTGNCVEKNPGVYGGRYLTIRTIGPEILVDADFPSWIHFIVCWASGEITDVLKEGPDHTPILSASFKAQDPDLIRYVRIKLVSKRFGEDYWVFSQPLFAINQPPPPPPDPCEPIVHQLEIAETNLARAQAALGGPSDQRRPSPSGTPGSDAEMPSSGGIDLEEGPNQRDLRAVEEAFEEVQRLRRELEECRTQHSSNDIEKSAKTNK
jgi:hypothetical protein